MSDWRSRVRPKLTGGTLRKDMEPSVSWRSIGDRQPSSKVAAEIRRCGVTAADFRRRGVAEKERWRLGVQSAEW